MASTYFFNGRLYTTPATMSAVDDTAMAPVSLTIGNVLAILGQSDGGQPGVAIPFGDPNQVGAVLVSGPLATAAIKAFAPSNQTNAPSTVIAVRVGAATPATLGLLDGTGNPSATLTSNQYGLPANRVKVSVAAGSVTGRLVTVQYGNSYYAGDNLTRSAFTIQYSGTAASASMAIAGSTVTLQAPTGSVVATIDLNAYPTVAQLADRISATSGFVATAIPGSGNAVALNGLDSVAAADVKTALYTAKADLQAVIDWINGPSQGLVTAARPANAGAPPANIIWTYLSGGTAPVPVMSDWTNALSMLQGQDVQWIVPLSGDPAVHAAVDAHVQYMSTVGQKERRSCVGPVLGTSLAAVQALPLALDSDRTSVVWPGYYDYDVNGNLTLFDPFYSAVLVAAGFSALDPGETMSNKTLTVRGLEVQVRNPTDTDPLIQSGVLVLEATKQGYKVVRAISTWLQDNKFNRVEVSCGAATDYVVEELRTALNTIRGARGDPRVLTRAVTIADTTLRTLAIPPPEGIGVIVGDAQNPPYRNITATLIGDAVAVACEASPVIPVNFVPISVSIVPYSGTASA